MQELKCINCGGNEWINGDGFRKCAFCGTTFLVERQSSISVNNDVERLLEKCRKEPRKAKIYANLILDIDPTNQEARLYLK